MFVNYLKTAWRSLVSNKSYSILNILGLATGMGVALLIGLWVYHQYSYDRFLPGYQQVYGVRIKYTDNGVRGVGPATPLPLTEAIKRDIPGVRNVVQTDWTNGHLLSTGDKKVFQTGLMAGTDFFRIFQYPFVKGSADVALKEINSIVLTESGAKALFGDQEAIGQSVRLDDSQALTVTGIMKDVPANSTQQFSYVIPFEFAMQNYGWIREVATNWRNNSFQTYVSLDANADPAKVQQQIGLLEKKYNAEDYRITQLEAFLHPMKDWHLYADFRDGVAGGFIDYVRLFAIIGVQIFYLTE